jgi:alpha-beta hydrolase superfamily lysophospholipase
MFRTVHWIGLGLGLVLSLKGIAWADFTLEETTQTLGGSQIAVYTSHPRTTPSSGIFVYSHGMTSRVAFHQPLLKKVYEAGFDVIAYDLPGHGNSEKTLNVRGGVRGLDQLINVLGDVIQYGKTYFKNSKVFVSGWSLGGLVTTLYLQNNPYGAMGAVLYAPGVALALMEGDLSILKGVSAERLVSDPKLIEQMKNDPGFFWFPPICLANAIVKGEWKADPEQYKTDTLLFTAGKDYFASSSKVRQFYRKARDLNATHLKIRHYQNSLHDLENDVDSESVLQKTVEYLKSKAEY